MAAEYALLFLLCQACVEWKEFGVAELAFFQVTVGVADIAFAAEEDEHVASGRATVFAFVCLDFAQGVLKLACEVLLFIGGTIMYRHRISAPRYLNHRHPTTVRRSGRSAAIRVGTDAPTFRTLFRRSGRSAAIRVGTDAPTFRT